MSITLMSEVWACDLPPTEKLVLMALADRANDDGVQCYPGIREICRKTGASERTVQGCIKRLVEAGHLTRNERPGKSVNYVVHPRKSCAPQKLRPAKTAPPQKATETPAESAPNTSGTISSEAIASGGGAPPADAEPDLKSKVFGTGVRLLTAAGTPDHQARAIVGKWRRDFGDPAVFEALAVAEREAATAPIPFITATLERRHDTRASSHQTRQHGHGPDRPGSGQGRISPRLAAGLAIRDKYARMAKEAGGDRGDAERGSDPGEGEPGRPPGAVSS
ncbi:MAG: hypothetical protein B7Y35_11250 [Sphingomonadales bacterium 28-64-96]|nr:MAG: hypothetical protein B7Y35_11250 [Sphingomonadales bacterium 28-64-96]